MDRMKMCGVCAHNLTLFIRGVRTVSELEDFQRVILHELATIIQKKWRGYLKRRRFLSMRRAQMIIAFSYRNYKRRCYLYWLAANLPSQSPNCRDWPTAPWLLHDANYYLRKYYHRWRCQKYRNKMDQTTRDRMREKMMASKLFRDRKISYARNLGHPFRGDYVRLRQNVKWKKLTTEAMANVNQIFRLSLSPFQDDIVVVHVINTETSKRKGAFVFESAHVIEIVTKLFLVIKNSTGIPIEVQIVSEFEANFGKENVLVLFRCSGPPEVFNGPAKISRKSGRLELVL
ncbi:Unconventional myosin-Ia [Halotydeus destructor]|nr:Unconventional myosin-Ia [Halotydeus destructor]